MSSSDIAAQKKRNELYQQRFGLPENEELIADFMCALHQKILMQGRLYISQRYVCFYSKIFSEETIHVIRVSDITRVTPAKSLGMIPNAIKISTEYTTFFFTSFVSRSAALALLDRVLKGEKLGAEDMVSEPSTRRIELAESQTTPTTLSDNDEDQDNNNIRRKKGTAANNKSTPIKKRTIKKPPSSSARNAIEDNDDDEDDDTGRHRRDNDDDDIEGTPRGKKITKSVPKMNGINNTTTSPAAGKKKMRAVANRDDDDEDREQDRQKAGHSDDDDDGGRKDNDEEDDDDDRRNRNIKRGNRSAKNDEDEDHEDEEDARDRRINKKANTAALRNNTSRDLDTDEDEDADDEILQKLKNSRKRTRGDYSHIYLYPALSTSTDPKVDSLHQRIKKQPASFSIAQPSRRFIYEGPLRRQGRWSVVDRWCFLFDDLFLFTKQIDRDRYQMKQYCYLDGLTIDIRPSSFQLPSLRKTKEPNPFRLIYTPNAVTPSPNIPRNQISVEYVVSTDSKAKKLEWATRFLLSIAAYHYHHHPNITQQFGWYMHYVIGTIHQAVYDHDRPLVEALLKEDKELIMSDDIEGRSVLHICAEQNDADMISFLLQQEGININKTDRDGYTAIHIAAKKGNINVLNALLADPTHHPIQFNLLHNTSRNIGHKRYKDTSALWLCILNHQAQYEECFTLLLSLSKATERKYIMEDRDDDGLTLLETVCHQHIIMDDPNIIPLLLRHGARIDLPNKQGLTPLSVAVKNNDLKLVEALIHNGAQSNLRFTPTLNSPLHYATNLDIASYLVSTGARTNLRNNKGIRMSDVYAAPREQTVLIQAEELHQKRAPIDTEDPMHPQATTAALNNGRSLDACALCLEDFTVLRKRDYCRRCGLNIDQACSTKKLIFRRKRNGKKERVLARVCDGCYNIVMFRAYPNDGGIGMKIKTNLKIKKKTGSQQQRDNGTIDTTGNERSRRGMSVSRKWEDIESEEDEDDHTGDRTPDNGNTNVDGGGGGDHTPTARHRRNDSDDTGEVVEDGAGLTGNIKSGLKKGIKGAWNFGGFIGGKLTNVFDSVTDTLTNVSVPKDSVQKGGVVESPIQPTSTDDTDKDGIDANGDDRDDHDDNNTIRSTPSKQPGALSKGRSGRSQTSATLVSSAPVSSSATSASSTRSAVSRSRALAANNLQQMREVEDKASNQQDEAETFGSLATQLKNKAKKGQL